MGPNNERMDQHSTLAGRPVQDWVSYSKVGFGFYSEQEIRRMSVVRIENPVIFDNLGRPLAAGLYDLRLGPIDKDASCETCGLSYFECPGHLGHIELATPAYNPLLFRNLYQLLRCYCFFCHSFRMGKMRMHRIGSKLRLLRAGLLEEAIEIGSRPFTTDGAKELLDSSSVPTEVKIYDMDDVEDELTLLLRSQEASGSYGDEKSVHIEEERMRTFQEFFSSHPKRCENCRAVSPSITKDGAIKLFRSNFSVKEKAIAKNKKSAAANKAFPDADADNESQSEDDDSDSDDFVDTNTRGIVYMSPAEVLGYMKSLWESDSNAVVLPYLFSASSASPLATRHMYDLQLGDVNGYQHFFVVVVPVLPNRFRPVSIMNDQSFEHPQNTYLQRILRSSLLLIELTNASATSDDDDDRAFQKILNALVEMQVHVNSLVDNTLGGATSSQGPAGIRQLLEKKEGMFRKHMMGKRVNFAARSVISPDPYIATNEVGIPKYFAMRLSFPEPATPWNIKTLREAVINGPKVYPGANFVEDERGRLMDLSSRTRSQRLAIAKTLLSNIEDNAVPKKVHRHLKNRDVLLVNRQPTLHKPGMMAHYVRVLGEQKVIRLHYANCNTYNADFDGDEMNLHCPQSYPARSEAFQIAVTSKQYCVPTSGEPLRGLIQDHVVGGVLLTKRDTFLSRDQYLQLLYAGCYHLPSNHPIRTVMPVILKPEPMWSGKQVITSLLNTMIGDRPAFNLDSKPKTAAKMWGPSGAEDGAVVFRSNELLVGVLDKSQFGASKYGLVHACYELYGPDFADMLLTALGRLFTRVVQFWGFTCGIDDCLLTDDADSFRRSQLIAADKACRSTSSEIGASEYSTRVPNSDEALESFGGNVNADAARIRGAVSMCSSEDRDKLERYLDMNVKTSINKLTSSILQKCLPDGQWKPFPDNNLSLMTVTGAKGSVVNFSQISCLLGQQEFEGRRVARTPRGRSLPSFVPFDTSARSGGFVAQRFLTGIRPQEYFVHCMAGRDGLVDTAVKTARSGYLQRCLIKHMEGMMVNYDRTVRDSEGSLVQFHYGEDSIDVTKTGYLNKMEFLDMNQEAFRAKLRFDDSLSALRARGQNEKSCAKLLKEQKKCTDASFDPIMSTYDPCATLGAVSLQYQENLSGYIKQNYKNRDAGSFSTLACLRYMQSCIDAGEPVGVLAAQSIGEPSTQMTLNTFHHTGMDAGHVTVGIPRLRELLMTASVKSGVLSVPVATPGEDVKRAVNLLAPVKMTKFLLDFTASENVVIGSGNIAMRSYRLDIRCDGRREALQSIGMSMYELKVALLSKFVPTLCTEVRRQLKLAGQRVRGDAIVEAALADATGDVDEDAPVVSRRKKGQKNDVEGSFAERQRSRKAEMATYEDDDGGDAEQSDDDADATGSKSTKSRKENIGLEGAKEVDVIRGRLASAYPFLYDATVADVVADGAQQVTLSLELQVEVTTKKLLIVSIAENAVKQCNLRSIRGIRNCQLVERNGAHSIVVDGLNAEAVISYAGSHLKLNELHSNDIQNFLQVYGVEGARALIVKELGAVFAGFGIAVDTRHVGLIADYVTFGGRYTPFNRIGIATNVSPFQKMSFETTTKFLLDALYNGDHENLLSPAASIVTGQVVKVGTNSFSVLQPCGVSDE